MAEGDPEPGAAVGRDVGHVNAVEARGNLVEEQKLGPEGERTRDLEPLEVDEPEGAHPALGLVGEPAQLERLPDPVRPQRATPEGVGGDEYVLAEELRVSDAADLGVVEAASLLARRSLSG